MTDNAKTKDRSVTTLFMLMSADGKISTGSTDTMDMDKDLPNIEGVREGLHQYYDIEQTTDLWSLNSGRVQAKIGVNERAMPEKSPVSFVLVDNSHLTEQGIRYFCARSKEFVLVTSNRSHPAFSVSADNLHIIFQEVFDPEEMLVLLKKKFNCGRITVQTGGTLNSIFLRKGLIDYVDIVVAPLLIGGKDTPTLIDGESITDISDLNKLGVMELQHCERLDGSYLRIKYRITRKKS